MKRLTLMKRMTPMKRLTHISLSLLAASVLSACGGGGGSDGSTDVANGGIGGTGSGTVTGFGSIFVNDIREFEFDDDSRVRIDGEESQEDDLKIGMVVNVNVGDDVNDDFTSGTLTTVDAFHLVKGPVTSVSPLRILSQDITVLDSTLLDDLSNVASLVVGDVVEVSGHRDNTGIIRATLLEYKAAGADVWQLRGDITATPSANVIRIGDQPVNTSTAEIANCGSGLSIGQFVEVKMSPVVSLNDGESIDATRVECVSSGLSTPDDVTTIKASFEGYIDAVTSATEFLINGQEIVLAGSVTYENGNASDLVVGARVEAEGVLNTTTGVLTASKIRFREAKVRIEAPVSPEDIVSGQRLTIMGVEVFGLGFTQDEDGVLDGLSEPTQVEIRGFLDSDGKVYAEEIRERGDADPEDTEIRGPVSAKTANSFTVLGLTVEASGVLLDQMRIGQQVKVADATFNNVELSLTGGEIELED